jgi:hypothetical protein
MFLHSLNIELVSAKTLTSDLEIASNDSLDTCFDNDSAENIFNTPVDL